jgi:uncharacterized repeat protein (TIGR01451 family)
MRASIYQFVLSLCFILFSILPIKAQWAKVMTPPDYSISGYYNAGSVTYAEYDLHDYGLYASTDGINFEEINLDFSSWPFFALGGSFGNIYAIGDTLFVLGRDTSNTFFSHYSTNRGATWDSKQLQVPNINFIGDFTLFCNSNRLFVSTEDGLYFSDDLGVTYTKHQSFSAEKVYILECDQNILFAEQKGIGNYRSYDNGTTWHLLSVPPNVPLTNYGLKYCIDDFFYLSASTTNGTIWYRLPSTGNQWEHLPQMPAGSIHRFFKINQTFYLTASNNSNLSTFTSTDDCQTWNLSFPDQIFDKIHNQVLYSLSSSNPNWELVSNNQGLSWKPGWIGLPNIGGNYSLATTTIGAHIAGSGANVFQYFDQFQNPEWTAQPTNHLFWGAAVADQDLLADFADNNLIYSLDGGRTFTNKQISLGSDYQLFAVFNGVLFFYSQTDLFTSIDFGTTVQPFTSLGNDFLGICKSNTHLCFRTIDGDIYAAERSNPLNFLNITPSVTSNISNIFGAGDFLFYTTFDDELFRFEGNGWVTCNITLSGSIYNPQGIGNSSELLLYDYNWPAQLFSSTDGGLNWVNISSEIPNLSPYGKLGMTNTHFYLAFEDINLSLAAILYSKPTTNSPLPLATGTVFHDENQNGLYEASEPPAVGKILKSAKYGFFAVSDSAGTFSIKYSDTPNDTIRAILQNKYQFITTPDAIADPNQTNPLVIGIATLPNKRDLCVTLSNDIVFRPGFETRLYATVSNVGTIAAGGQLSVFLPSQLTFINSIPAASSQIGDTLYFNIPDLQIGQTTQILITVKTTVSTSIGTQLSMTAQIDPIATDEDPLNNSNTLREVVVGSYDPNDKAVSPTNLTPVMAANRETMYYTVRFQNTGNFPATYVRILDTLDQRLDVETIQVLAASHDYSWKLHERNILDVFFDNINLLDSFSNEPESHGFVKFAIKPKAGMQLGQSISNTAHIYFDFNAAIVTNTVTSSVLVRTQEPVDEPFTFSVSPNPGVGPYMILLDKLINEPMQVQVYDANGRLCTETSYERVDEQFTLPAFHASSGVYLVQLSTKTGKVSRQLVVR